MIRRVSARLRSSRGAARGGSSTRASGGAAGLKPLPITPPMTTKEEPSAVSPEPPLRISAATAAHEETVLGLMREFYAAEHLEFREEVARAALRELWANPRTGLVFLLHLDEVLVGYAILTFGFSLEFRGRDALVDELYVRERHRGGGIGGRTLAWLEEICREEGIHALHLEVDHANPSAKRLYNRVGFVDHDRHLLTKRLDGSPLKPRPEGGTSE